MEPYGNLKTDLNNLKKLRKSSFFEDDAADVFYDSIVIDIDTLA